MVGSHRPRCFAPSVRARSGGEQTERLRRRTLYETTAAQSPATQKRYPGNHFEPDAANGDLRLGVCVRAGSPDAVAVRSSRSYGARLDVSVGGFLSRASRATDAELRRLAAEVSTARGDRDLKRGALSETSQYVTDYGAKRVLSPSVNGADNLLRYGVFSALPESDVNYPGVVVDENAEASVGFDDGYTVLRLDRMPPRGDSLVPDTVGASDHLRALSEDLHLDAGVVYPVAPLTC